MAQNLITIRARQPEMQNDLYVDLVARRSMSKPTYQDMNKTSADMHKII